MWSPSRAPTRSRGSGHLFWKNENLSGRAENPDGSTRRKFDNEQGQVGFTLGGPLVPRQLFYFLAGDFQDGRPPSRPIRRASSSGSSTTSPASAIPGENGPIERTNDARVFLAKAGLAGLGRSNLVTLRGTYTWSEQKNGTFDVDSWGTQRQRHREGRLAAPSPAR